MMLSANCVVTGVRIFAEKQITFDITKLFFYAIDTYCFFTLYLFWLPRPLVL